MKKKKLNVLNLNKKSISNLAIHGGAPPPRDTEATVCAADPSEPSEPSRESFVRGICQTTIFTVGCPSDYCY